MIGLPSLHTLDASQGVRIWLASEATDMRCGFDRLAERVESGDWSGPAQWALVRVSFAMRGKAEDLGVGPRWIRFVVQASRGWGV